MSDEELQAPSTIDDAETRAFIDGWNAKLAGEHDFDMALHWWKRERCGLNSADDLAQASTTIEQLTPQAGGDDLERVARELLAAEYEKLSYPVLAKLMREKDCPAVNFPFALRAIIAAIRAASERKEG